MTEIKDNPPPLPEPEGYYFRQDDLYIGGGETIETGDYREDQVRQIEAAAFARGVVAGQEATQEEIARLNTVALNRQLEIRDLQYERDELLAKLKALEEQEPVAWREWIDGWQYTEEEGEGDPIYLAAGAKHD